MDPIFIVGAPRSGTTLVSTILDNHPGVYVGPKAHGPHLVLIEQLLMQELGLSGDCRDASSEKLVVSALSKKKGRFARLFRFLDLDQADLEDTDMRTLLLTCFEQDAKAHGKRIWGDKCPAQVETIPQLVALFPTAKILHVIRDGRAVAVSQRDRQYEDLLVAMHSWKRMLLKGRFHGKYLSADRYLEVRYEDLLRTPHESLEKICAFVGVEFESVMLDLVRHPDVSASAAYVGGTIDPQKAEAWRKRLTIAELRRLETIAGDVLQAFGYSLSVVDSHGPFKALTPLQYLARRQAALFRDLLRRRREVMWDRKIVTVERGCLTRSREFFARSVNLWVNNDVLDCVRKRKKMI